MDSQDKQFLRSYENQLLTELYLAYLKARVNGKRRTIDEQKFEVDEMLNLKLLCHDLIHRTYQPSRGVAHIIHNPVIREIFAAPFVDRVVHHWIYEKIYDWWDKRFIYDAYSCREKKGTLLGIKRLDTMIRRASRNYAEPVWVVKMDIQGYFMSLDRKKLYERVLWGLNQQYKGKTKTREYQILRYAIRVIIFDDPVRGVRKRGWPDKWRPLPKSKSLFCQPPGQGIVIGNLTSQLFSNIYLDQLDRYIKYTLGYQYYGRYVDDFFLVLTKDQLSRFTTDIRAIRNYLRILGLTLHPKKLYIQRAERGTQFLGGVVYPGHIQPSERIKCNYRASLKSFSEGKLPIDSIVSYMGHVVHLSYREFERKLYQEFDWGNPKHKPPKKKQNGAAVGR